MQAMKKKTKENQGKVCAGFPFDILDGQQQKDLGKG